MGRARRSKDAAEFLSAFRADLDCITLEIGGLEELAVRYGLPGVAKEHRAGDAVAVLPPPMTASPPAKAAAPPPPEPPLPGPDPAPEEARAPETAAVSIQSAPRSGRPVFGPPAAPPAAIPPREPGAGPARPETRPATPDERETAPTRSRRVRAWAVLALLLAGAGAWRACRVWEASVESRAHRVFPLPFTHSGLLAGDGRRLFTVDPVRSLLFTIDVSSLRVGGIQKLAGHRPGGLAWWDASLWSTDPEAGRIVEHEADAGLSVRRAFTNPESRPAALFWDGRHLWTTDARTETISQYAVSGTLKLVRQYTLAGVDPIGLYVEGDLLWVMDRATQRVLRYRPKSLLEAHDALDFAAWLPPRSHVTGFTVQEGVVWIVTEDPAEIHGFDLALLDGLRARRRARSLLGGGP